MKKTIATILISGMLSLALCGCGSYSGNDRGRDNDILPNVPMATPNVNDGLVDDRDGLIEDHDAAENDRTMPTVEPTKQPERP